MRKKKQKTSSKYTTTEIRYIVIFCVIMAGMAISCLQIALINIRQFNAASTVSNSKSLVLGESRGLIYDTNMHRLVCVDYSFVSAVKPTVAVLPILKNYINDVEYNRVSESVVRQLPILINTDCLIKDDDVVCERIYKRYNYNQAAAHIIGYVDSSGHNGLAGIEKTYNSFLESNSGSCRVRFITDGKGAVMLGGKAQKISDNFNSLAGVVLTINKHYQTSLEKAMDECGITKGAGILIDIESGAVLASVSRPVFDPGNVAEYLDDADSALFNRAFGVFPVGSVFKPLIAASALEQGIDPKETFNCDGVISENSSTFRCTKAHGNVDMSSAIAYSCNCYFVDLIQKIDCSQVIDLAASLGFGNVVALDSDIKTHSGYLPDTNELNSFAARANFSFGQGNLSANPYQIAMLYSMIANGGEYKKPFLIKGFYDGEGNFKSADSEKPPVKLISKKTAKLLQEYLEFAVNEGTGQSAKAGEISVAGKTATAQSGETVNGKERLVTWFAGFFPCDKPKYVAVIVCEDGKSGSEDCAPVFSMLARSVLGLNN